MVSNTIYEPRIYGNQIKITVIVNVIVLGK